MIKYEMCYNKRIRLLLSFGGYVDYMSVNLLISNKITDEFTNEKKR
jgi:hypothetical protein